MRWVKHVARVGIQEIRTQFWFGSLKGGDQSKGVGGRMILKWLTFVIMDWICLAEDDLVSSCQHGNENSSSVKGWKFVD